MILICARRRAVLISSFAINEPTRLLRDGRWEFCKVRSGQTAEAQTTSVLIIKHGDNTEADLTYE
jgi:hypothetical protein